MYDPGVLAPGSVSHRPWWSGPPVPSLALISISSARPLDGAAGVADRRRGLVARNDFVDVVKVFRIVLSARLRFANEGRRHQLMVALAVIDLVGLQLDVVGQLEILERSGELDRVERFLLVGDQGKAHRGRVAEPVPRGRHMAVVDLADVSDELVDAGNARLLPVPFEHPGSDPRLRRKTGERLQLLLCASDTDLLVEAELHDLLEAVDH